MARIPETLRARRVNLALELLQSEATLAEAARSMAHAAGISRRQAYRYLQEAQGHAEPIPIPDHKSTFTVKLSDSVISDVRKYASVYGLTLSEIVAQALEAFLRPGRWRG